MIKRMKDMKDMVNAAPDMVAQAQQLGAQAQQMAAAQQAAAMQARMAQGAYGPAGAGLDGAAPFGAAPFGNAPAGADFEPVAGVSLDQFVAVSKAVAAFGYDQSKLAEIAGRSGISAQAWETASLGWNDRIKRNPAVAQRFNQIYRAS